MSDEPGQKRKRNKRNTTATTSRRTVKCQRPKVSADEWMNRTPGSKNPGNTRTPSSESPGNTKIPVSTANTKTVVKCQKPGISAEEYFINNNLGKCAKIACQQQTEQISLTQCPAKVVSKVPGKGAEKIVRDQTSLSSPDTADNTRDRLNHSNGELAGEIRVGVATVPASENTKYKREKCVSSDTEISCVKPTPGVIKSDNSDDKNVESAPNIEIRTKIIHDTTLATKALMRASHSHDSVSTDCDNPRSISTKPEESLDLDRRERKSDQQIELGVPIQSSLTMAGIDNIWDGSSVDNANLSRHDTNSHLSPKIFVYVDKASEGSSVDKPYLATQQNRSLPCLPGQMQKTYPLGKMSLDVNVRASAPDLVSSHLSHTPHISKDHVFLRTHRRTSSLQLARRLSSDLTTIPEELEKRHSAEHPTIDIKGGFSRNNTLPRGFKANYDEYVQRGGDEGERVSKASSVICNNICQQWSGDTTSKVNHHTLHKLSTSIDSSIDTRHRNAEESVISKPHIPTTKPKGVSNTRTSNKLRKKVKSDLQPLNDKPSIPLKPKKGDSSFKRFKEAGEHIKKSVKARKNKEVTDKSQSTSETCKAKPERNTRRKVFHSKKTRDAHAKINIRDTSKESSQEELSKQSEKSSSKNRSNRYSKGVELFKSLREKNEGNNDEKGKYDNIRKEETVSDTSVQSSESSSSRYVQQSSDTIADRKQIEDHAGGMNDVDSGHSKKDGTSGDVNVMTNRPIIKSNADDELPLSPNKITNHSKEKEFKDAMIIPNGFVYFHTATKSGDKEVVSDELGEIYPDKTKTDNICDKHPQKYIHLEGTGDELDKSSDTDNDKSRESDKTDDSSVKTDSSYKIYDTTDEKTYDTTDDKTYDTTDDKTYDTTTDDKTYDSTDKMEESEKTDSTSDESDTTTESRSSLSMSEEKSDTDDKSSVDGMTMELDWRRRAYSRRREDSEDDREWKERSKRMTANLEWIRNEIGELKKQDQSLMRQFLQLRSTIHAMKRNQGSLTKPTNAQSCNFLHFPIAGNLSASFHDLSQFGSSNSINNALINIDNELNGNMGSLDGTSGGNEYLPEFRARTVSLVNGSRSTDMSEVAYVKPRTMTFSGGSKDTTERGLYESGEIPC
ncbi:uncharacterized protein [Amphiura filiformis]|uniref:uncharacterized protein n=1 Tax=Amphiura filiformis TaxID=82378 RepID=UPI003B228DF3